MICRRYPLLIILVLSASPALAQRLKKSDRAILANIKSHISVLENGRSPHSAGTYESETSACEYIRKNFERFGLKPGGGRGEWVQTFEVYKGRAVEPSTLLAINGDTMELGKDYFPFPFSGNAKTSSTVAIALAEHGVPWFKDIRDLDSAMKNAAVVTESIQKKAAHASSKGATALLLYSNTTSGQPVFDKWDRAPASSIPVVFIGRAAFDRYLKDESAVLDIDLEVSISEEKKPAQNVVAYADNGADSTIFTFASLNNTTSVAALLELARIARTKAPKSYNYLFVAFSGEEEGKAGNRFFTANAPVELEKISRTLNIDSLADTHGGEGELVLVKKTAELFSHPDKN